MKVKESLLLSLLMSVGQLGFSQSDKSTRNADSTQLTPAPRPLVILQSDDRFLILDPKKNETFDFDAIEPKSIKSITVLKDEKARNAYGDKGQNGVLVIRLVDNYVLSKSALMKSKQD